MRPRAAAVVLLVLPICACRPASDQAPAAVEPASAPAAAPKPDVPSAYLGDLDAVGTEPFWSLKIRKGGLMLERPDVAPLAAPNPGPAMEGIVAVWKSDPLGVRVRRGACSDGMSDRDYPMFAEVRAGGVTLKGCAVPAEG